MRRAGLFARVCGEPAGWQGSVLVVEPSHSASRIQPPLRARGGRWKGCVDGCVREPSEATSERANSGWAIGAKRPQSARRCKGTT